MVIDEPNQEEPKPFASLSEYNQHLESSLPEIYLDDIYKYLRDCEVNHQHLIHD